MARNPLYGRVMAHAKRAPFTKLHILHIAVYSSVCMIKKKKKIHTLYNIRTDVCNSQRPDHPQPPAGAFARPGLLYNSGGTRVLI